MHFVYKCMRLLFFGASHIHWLFFFAKFDPFLLSSVWGLECAQLFFIFIIINSVCRVCRTCMTCARESSMTYNKRLPSRFEYIRSRRTDSGTLRSLRTISSYYKEKAFFFLDSMYFLSGIFRKEEIRYPLSPFFFSFFHWEIWTFFRVYCNLASPKI